MKIIKKTISPEERSEYDARMTASAAQHMYAPMDVVVLRKDCLARKKLLYEEEYHELVAIRAFIAKYRGTHEGKCLKDIRMGVIKTNRRLQKKTEKALAEGRPAPKPRTWRKSYNESYAHKLVCAKYSAPRVVEPRALVAVPLTTTPLPPVALHVALARSDNSAFKPVGASSK